MPVARFELPGDGLAAAEACLAARLPAGDPGRLRSVARRSAAYAFELRATADELLAVAGSEIWRGQAQRAFADRMRAKAPSLSATAERYQSYSTALIGYAGVLESSLWQLSTARRELAWRHAAAAGQRPPRATAAVAVADGHSAPELLSHARRFKTGYDHWADAVDRCAGALLQANAADPTRDLHGLQALGHNIGKAAEYVDPLGQFLLHPSWESLSDCLGVLSTELTILGLGLLFIFPPAGAACLAVATALSVAQLGVDTYRKSHGEHVSNGTLGLEMLGAIPVVGKGTKLAKLGLDAVEHVAPKAAPVIERTVTRLVPDGGLIAHEKAGGHTLKKHVGKTDEDLRVGLDDEPHIRAASTFADQDSAETILSDVLNAKQAEVQGWLSGPKGKDFVLDHMSSNVTGRCMVRGATESVDAYGVRMILRHDPKMPGGFRIQTAMVMP